MIVTNIFFKGPIYISYAKPDASISVNGVKDDLLEFIDYIEEECLIKILGYDLANEFISNIDTSRPNLLKLNSDIKWDKLLNGTTYTDINGKNLKWNGLRFKSFRSTEYDMSLLANYIYFMYEADKNLIKGGVSHGRAKSKNIENAVPTFKAIRAWNKFIELTRGKTPISTIIHKQYGIGLIYSSGINKQMSLHRFINDSNDLVPNTYSDFLPEQLKEMNTYGL